MPNLHKQHMHPSRQCIHEYYLKQALLKWKKTNPHLGVKNHYFFLFNLQVLDQKQILMGFFLHLICSTGLRCEYSIKTIMYIYTKAAIILNELQINKGYYHAIIN